MFKKKKVEVVKPAPTTAEIMKSAMARVDSDIKSLNCQKDGALSVFRGVATKLGMINKELEKSVATLDSLMKFATEQKSAVEKHIVDNEKVKEKIIAIIGE